MPPSYKKVLPLEDQPINYGTGTTDDAVVKMLVREHGVDPAAAVALAPKLIGENSAIAGQAVGAVAMREAARLRQMKRYTDLKRAEESGEELDEVERAWMQRIDQRRDELIQERARQTLEERQPASPSGRAVTEGEMARMDGPAVDQRAATLRSFRPGMQITDDGAGLIIPVRPSSRESFMQRFGTDEVATRAFEQNVTPLDLDIGPARVVKDGAYYSSPEGLLELKAYWSSPEGKAELERRNEQKRAAAASRALVAKGSI